MSDPLFSAMAISSAGLNAQSVRMRVISENIANAGTTGTRPGEDPYARKSVSFAQVMDHQKGLPLVEVAKVSAKADDFSVRYDPNHPAADQNGMVKTPNVDLLVEVADMREAVRSYQANVQAIKQARNLISMTVDMLRP